MSPETPSWLREAGGGLEKVDEAVEVERAQQEEERARLAAEQAAEQAAEMERRLRESKAAQTALAIAEGAQRASESTAEELRARCDNLLKERDELLQEKGALLAEVARSAGHLNHKQKIHYVARLKEENDELRAQLKMARDVRKENVPSIAQECAFMQGKEAGAKETTGRRAAAVTSSSNGSAKVPPLQGRELKPVAGRGVSGKSVTARS